MLLQSSLYIRYLIILSTIFLWFSFDNKEKNNKESGADCQRKIEDQIAHIPPWYLASVVRMSSLLFYHETKLEYNWKKISISFYQVCNMTLSSYFFII